MTEDSLTGTVLRAQGGVYEVETSDGVVEAKLRGRIKREERTGEKVVAGDRVEIERGESGGRELWTIETVHERSSVLLRRAPGKAPRPKPIVANVDRVLVVFAVARPDPHLRMLDRFLVICEASGLDAVIVANKVDLTGEAAARQLFGIYERVGYPVVYTSVKQGIGITELRERLRDTTSVLTGPSGVGKSSLLNSIQPGLGLRVAAISEAVLKGRHTTVTAQLIPLEGGGYVADTPGLRELGLWGIDREELDGCFPEFEPYLGTCRYGNSCTHSHEPGCAVKAAAAAGEIPAERFESYLRLLDGDDE
jgi:ribosome biogenesis GTPase / thiamine phosphate phosphatase